MILKLFKRDVVRLTKRGTNNIGNNYKKPSILQFFDILTSNSKIIANDINIFIIPCTCSRVQTSKLKKLSNTGCNIYDFSKYKSDMCTTDRDGKHHWTPKSALTWLTENCGLFGVTYDIHKNSIINDKLSDSKLKYYTAKTNDISITLLKRGKKYDGINSIQDYPNYTIPDLLANDFILTNNKLQEGKRILMFGHSSAQVIALNMIDCVKEIVFVHDVNEYTKKLIHTNYDYICGIVISLLKDTPPNNRLSQTLSFINELLK